MSNQEAIALLRNLEEVLDSYCELNEEGKTAFRIAIEVLSSSEIPNSSDTISRAKAIDLLKQMRKDGDMIPWEGKDVFARIRKLPSAQPERIRGWWTRDNACSECGCQPWFSGDIHNYNFCPNCGAQMEVTT